MAAGCGLFGEAPTPGAPGYSPARGSDDSVGPHRRRAHPAAGPGGLGHPQPGPAGPSPDDAYLDALEARVSNGRGSPALADALARAGIGHVLLRHDLDAGVTTAPPAERAGAALRQSGGLTLVRSFDDDAGRSRLDVYRVERHVGVVGRRP